MKWFLLEAFSTDQSNKLKKMVDRLGKLQKLAGNPKNSYKGYTQQCDWLESQILMLVSDEFTEEDEPTWELNDLISQYAEVCWELGLHPFNKGLLAQEKELHQKIYRQITAMKDKEKEGLWHPLEKPQVAECSGWTILN